MSAKYREKPVEVGGLIDKQGNKLVLMSDDSVILRLYGEPHSRYIGLIRDNVLYVERDSAKHTHRQTDSYGFNYYLLKNAKRFVYVQILEDGCVSYRIPVSSIIDYGKILHFKYGNQVSFELQIFLRKQIIKNYRVSSSTL